MLSRLTLYLQHLTTRNSRGNLSFKIKPIISRNLAWFAGQSVKETFGTIEFFYTKKEVILLNSEHIEYKNAEFVKLFI
jgi:hypothetical protein